MVVLSANNRKNNYTLFINILLDELIDETNVSLALRFIIGVYKA